MTLRMLAVALAVLFLAACDDNTRPVQSNAQKTQAELQQMAQAHNANVKDPDQKVVCERVAVIGSHFTQLQCHTVWQQKQDQKDAQNYLDRQKVWETHDP